VGQWGKIRLFEQERGASSEVLIASATYRCNPQTALGMWGAECFHSSRCEVAGELGDRLCSLQVIDRLHLAKFYMSYRNWPSEGRMKQLIESKNSLGWKGPLKAI